MTHRVSPALSLLAAVTVLIIAGPSAATQQPAIAYAAIQLNCARFVEVGESRILTEAGGRTRRQTSNRRGTWQFRAVQADTNLVLEGWLDSLTITRRSEETAISPDTDGLLGGRYKGTLSRTGTYSARLHPFVPDEVAEVAGMATALDDYFPQVAPRSLGIGQSWTDSAGLTIRRLPDSTSSGVSLYRFELRKQGKSQVAASANDTAPLRLQQESDEAGQFVWNPQEGLLRRERSIVVETTVPPSRSVRQAVRSKVEQRLTLVRTSNARGCSSD
jgi:hypothetical protein